VNSIIWYQSWRPGAKIKVGRGKGRCGGGSGRVDGGTAAWGERMARRLGGRGRHGGLGERAVRCLEGDCSAMAWGMAGPWTPWKITTGEKNTWEIPGRVMELC
jgi:hypothetical protein